MIRYVSAGALWLVAALTAIPGVALITVTVFAFSGWGPFTDSPGPFWILTGGTGFALCWLAGRCVDGADAIWPISKRKAQALDPPPTSSPLEPRVPCPYCRRSLRTEQGLSQHVEAKHQATPDTSSSEAR